MEKVMNFGIRIGAVVYGEGFWEAVIATKEVK